MKIKYLIPVMLIFFSVNSCETMGKSFLKKKPEASIEKFDIASISLRDIDLLFDVGINNPYPVGLKLAGVNVAFFIEGNQVFKTSTKKGFKIGAKKKEITQFIVNLKYKDIERAVKSYLNKDYLQCDVKGEIIIPLPKIPGLPPTYKFPFKLGKKIPAIKPVIKIANFKVKQPSVSDIKESLKKIGKETMQPDKLANMFGNMLKGKSKPKDVIPKDLDVKIDVSFDIVLENKTRSKILFKSLDYNFFVNNSPLVDGKTNDIKTSGNKSVLKVINQFSSKALSKSILDAFKKKSAGFKVKGRTFLQLPESIRKEPLKLEFDENGNFKL